jgi:hypothetical protein
MPFTKDQEQEIRDYVRELLREERAKEAVAAGSFERGIVENERWLFLPGVGSSKFLYAFSLDENDDTLLRVPIPKAEFRAFMARMLNDHGTTPAPTGRVALEGKFNLRGPRTR